MSSGDCYDLQRFVAAQREIYDQVLTELRLGRKESHWMWFIFPQLAGLGHSAMAERYALRNLEQAKRYLAHRILGDRLRQVVGLMLQQKDKSALDILGSPDDLKFRSCLSLFVHAAANEDDRTLFKRALDQFYEGKSDPRTAQLMAT